MSRAVRNRTDSAASVNQVAANALVSDIRVDAVASAKNVGDEPAPKAGNSASAKSDVLLHPLARSRGAMPPLVARDVQRTQTRCHASTRHALSVVLPRRFKRPTSAAARYSCGSARRNSGRCACSLPFTKA